MGIASHAAISADPREHEIRLLVDLLRLSRVTVLHAEAGAGKSTVLNESVMPLLQEGSAGAQKEVAVLFDAWEGSPIVHLKRRIVHAVSERQGALASPDDDTPAESLAGMLHRLNETLGVGFVLIFDRFEEHLTAPGVEDDEFEDELVGAVDDTRVRAHFLLALDESAAPLMGRLQARLPGLGDARVRLSRPAATVEPEREAPAQPRLIGSPPPPQEKARGVSLAERLAHMRAQQEARGESAVEAPAPAPGNKPATTPAFSVDEPMLPIPEMPSEPVSAAVPPMSPAEKIAPPVPPISLGEKIAPPVPTMSREENAAPPVPQVPMNDEPARSSPNIAVDQARRGRYPASNRILAALLALLIVVASIVVIGVRDRAEPPASPSLSSPPSAGGPSASAPAPPMSTSEAPASSVPEVEATLRSEHEYWIQHDRMGYDELGTLASATGSSASAQSAAPAPTPAPPTPAERSGTAADRKPSAYEVVVPGPHVFIHVRSESQRARAEGLIQPLARRGIHVSGIRVVSAGPAAPDLRYFRSAEREEAQRVARALRDAGVPAQRLKHIPGYERRSTPRQDQLWLPPGR